MSQIDKRISVNTIIQNQLPSFLVADFPNATEFLKQYYISQEFQGGPSDLISNLDQYIKSDNLVPEVVTGTTTLSANIDSEDTIISVPSTKGFPSEYGLLKINDEIISYTGITSTSFTGCIRGFSGITGYNVGISSSLLEINREHLVFEETTSEAHTSGEVITNLSVLFLQEFYKKLKRTFLPGLEDNDFSENIDVGNFVKFARSFYQSKGVEESVRILFKVLYGVESTILDLEGNLIKPSGAEFIRREVIVADLITTTGDPQNLVGQTIFKSSDTSTNASVSEVEILRRDSKTYYKISLFVGFSDRDLIEGVFTVPGKTKALKPSLSNSSVISVDSTVGFGTTGTIVSGQNNINYTSKTLNQFFGCTGIGVDIDIADDIRSDETIFGYENGDLSKRVDLRITGVLSELVTLSDIRLVNEGEKIFVKNVGEKIKNNGESYKEIFANSWKYNTSSRFQVGVDGSTFTLKTPIDKSNLKVNDSFTILKRGEQVVVGTFDVGSVDTNLNQITTKNVAGFTTVSNQLYDIRRNLETATSNGIEIGEGNDVLLTDVINVYANEEDGYVASNSLPNYNIDVEVIKETTSGISLDGLDKLSGKYNFIQFSPAANTNIKFIQGDAVVYEPKTEVLSGLESGRTYYVDPVIPGPNQSISKIALYQSANQIGTASTIQVGIGTTTTNDHSFTLQKHANRKLEPDKILRKIPLSQNLFVSSKHETPTNDIGILIDGVQIRSPISDNKIYYGPLESVEVINSGKDYDVANPPSITVEKSSGTTALVEPVLEGEVEEVIVDPQDFDIESVTSISLTGGNGTGCVLQPIIGIRNRFIDFDTRNIAFNGGIDINDETITFLTKHNLENGQLVYYSSNGNSPIGIGSAYDSSNTIKGTLSDGDPYFVRIVNTSTVRIFNNKSDALFGSTGINTVGLSTDSAASGIHRFRTENKTTLRSVKVLNSGSGYTHRKLRVKPTGISTSYDTVNFKNHGFSSGEIIEYSADNPIQGLSTSTSYIVKKIDSDTFKLSNAGIAGTSTVDFDRGKYVNFTTKGTGYQIFKYPDIKVNIEVSFGSTITGAINLTPVVSGKIIDAYLYENGTNYGSSILNHQVVPEINIENGKNAELKPIIVNGKIERVSVVNKGSGYTSSPLVKIVDGGSGTGASVRPVISGGQIIDAIVVNTGIGYSSFTTSIILESKGSNASFSARVRSLTLNDTKRFGQHSLTSRVDSLNLGVFGYSQSIASTLEDSFTISQNGEFNEFTKHSPIIGWAYDGNPIYGPFGYSESDNINSSLKIITSSYNLDVSKLTNRPPGFEEGFFIDDYFYDGSGDLDIHNGRFCKTPEFPKGIYAYFTSIGLGTATNKIEPKYPYFIGKSFRSPLIQENITLTQDFDFNNSDLLRNTLPYNVDEQHGDNDFIIESNETIRQLSTIESVTKGGIDDLTILEGGSGYKIGDTVIFDDGETDGSGFSAVVDEIVGIGVSRIDTNLTRFEDSVFVWKSSDEVVANYLPYMEMQNNSSISISGLSTTIVNLSNSFKVGVSTNSIGLAKTMNLGSTNGVIEDIYVTDIPNTVSIGGSLRIGQELVRVLNLYDVRKVIRVQRNEAGGVGIAHTAGSNISVLNNRISIPVKTTKFNSKLNDIIYFNGKQSVGLGTTPGSAHTTEYVVGEIKENVSIPTRTIRLPNHPFKTGQKVTLNRRAGASRFGVSDTGAVQTFQIPQTGLSQDLYVINKGEDYIGLVTSNTGIGSISEGLFFHTNGTASGIGSGLYYFQSNFTQVKGDVDKVTTTVTTNVSAADTTTHNLKDGDIVKMNVVPNLSVGIGTTTSISVNYNSEFEKLIINPILFNASDVETNQIDINNHGLKTGDKILYDGGATGLSTGTYFVNTINSRYFQLAETLSDLSSTPIKVVSITANTGGSNQSVSLINPRIDVVKNSKLTFGLSSSTLFNFDFKLFYDKDLTNEYSSSQDTTDFNIVGVGTIGIGTSPDRPLGAELSVQFSDSSPEKLYYGLSKGGYISTSDTSVQHYSEIRFVDSIYNGEYEIFNVTDDKFDFSPLDPEFNTYLSSDCEKLEYSTRSSNVHGAIKDFKINSSGFNYKKLPKFESIESTDGKNANIVAVSTSIGRINDIRIVDIGYEYSSDKTLSPEAFISPVVSIDNLDIIDTINIVDGGSNYITAPNLLVFNPVTNKIVDNSSLSPIAPNQTISEIKVLAPVTGLDSVNHTIIAINNSNGIGINSIQSSSSGLVTCFLETPMNGFQDPQPFATGDEIFVEGIQRIGEIGIGATQGGISTNTTVEGDGFNSENYNYQFFTVQDYIAGTQAIIKFNLAGLTTNTGIAKTFQSGYASIVNKNVYPILEPVQTRGVFELNENLLVNNQITQLSVVEIRDDFVKIDGKFDIKKGDRIKGRASGVSAEITSIINNRARFKTNFSNRQEYGWIDDIGKLNEDYQVIPDNDYYQNLSYTVKSTVEWEKFVNPINRLVHPAGLKNFADTSIESKVTVGVGTTALTKDLIVLDVNNVLGLEDKQRVDAINNFDFVTDYDTRLNSSKFVELSNKVLTDYSRCKTNRVLLHDDISSNFSSTGFQENNTIIEQLTEDYSNYIIQIIDPDSQDIQLTELVVLTTTDNAYLLEKSTDFTTLKLGDFSTEITIDGIKNLIFTPTEKFTKDHNIKVFKIDFNTDLVTSGGNSIGNIDLTGANVSTGIGTTTTIAEFSKTDFNGLHANIFVQNSVTKEINYNEVVVDFDGVDTTTAQTYIDTLTGLSNSTVGIITSVFENDKVKLQVINDGSNSLDVRSNIVGLGTTTSGSGTYRFSASGQPSGAERSIRLESNYVTGTASTITYSTLNKTIDSSAKSIVRVSYGETSAIHQVISLKDADDILTVQYPFVSAGSTTGIGTFGGEIVGNNVNLRFYPDSEVQSLVEVQAYNQIFYADNDFANTPPDLNYGPVTQKVFLSTYDGLSGLRANKIEFDLKHDGVPIYQKTFNPIGINSITDGVGLVKSTGVFNIPNHFFNTNEELKYEPNSTFIGVNASAVSIASTANMAGVVTTILPSTVFAKVIDENRFQLFTRPEYISSGAAVTFTSSGSGNAHKLSMTKELTKTIIGLDGVVQQPVTFTSISHTFGVFDGFTHQATVGVGVTQFVLSGISSITTSDILKIGEEYMTVTEVGFTSTTTGTINDAVDVSLGIATLPTVKVRRGQLGLPAVGISSGASVRVHRGSFNIVDSKVYFTDPPKGNTRSRRDETNLPFVKADYSGRTFLRSDYTTNMIFDDISDSFTGIGKTYNLTVGGANTAAGIGVGNGILFINGVFQTPLTQNNVGNNYSFISDTTAGISTVEFTGITSTNGDFIVSDSDINQNQVPRGGIIVSLGSTPGLGYAPLQGAKVKALKNSAGGLTSIVGIGTSSKFSIGIQTAIYDNASGIITVTTNSVHGFGLERPNTVKLKGLEFRCPKASVGTPTNATYTPSNGNFVITIPNHGLANGDAVVIDDNAFTFKCAMDGNNSNKTYPRSTDPASGQYLTVSNVTTNTFRVNVGASPLVNHQVSAATYNPNTGLLVLTIGSHSLTAGTAVRLADNGFTFTCAQDSHGSNHTYPRSGDPAYQTAVNITAVGATTITLNVGTSSNTTAHTFVSAVTNAVVSGGNYSHTFVSAVADSVKTIGGGGYVGVTTTIFQDHERPLFVVGIVSDRTFEVRAGASTIPHTYQGGGHVYEFFEDLTFGSGYRGGSVAIGITDQAYEHRFVSSGIGSIKKTNFAGDGFTATNANYISHTGNLILTIPNHTFTTSDSIGIDTGGLTFKCSKDDFFSNHPYPREVSKTRATHTDGVGGKDPFAGVTTGIGATTIDTVTFFVGQGGGGGTGANVTATVGVGGTLAFNIVSAGTSYVNPEILIPEPNYDNLPIVGISRLGLGATTDTGTNLLVDVQVSAAQTTVGIGSTTFEISKFQIARPGYSFKIGDKFKPVGLVTAAHLSQPINEFQLEVLDIFNDQFSAWQFGELDFIDDIRNLQNGSRKRFPLFFNGQLLSFEKDTTNSQSALIDLDAVLLIFVNGVLQKPGESYQFQGGTTFIFNEAPSGESSPGANDHDKVDIFFYKGQDGVDVDLVDVQETVKRGDEIKVLKTPIGISTAQDGERTIKELLGADLIETNIYTGLGVDENVERPIRWTKQKVDLIVNGEIIDKSRPILEPQVYPTAKIIGDLSITSGTTSGNNIFVDNVDSFFYEAGTHIEPKTHVEDISRMKYNITINKIDALVTSGTINVSAAATAIVSAAGTITEIDITNAGKGYSSVPTVSITPPVGAGLTVGVGSTAFGTAVITNGTVSKVNLNAIGLGYTRSNPPQVLIGAPNFQTEKITEIDNIEGFTGIITGIQQTTNSGQLALKFFYKCERTGDVADNLQVGYPIMITNTTVGNGVTSVNTHNSSIVGIGTTFLDNIYIVRTRVASGGENGEITCNILNGTSSYHLQGVSGIGTGNYNFTGSAGIGSAVSLGRLSWGRLYNGQRSDNPISIGVTGLTINSGLTTFPTIQRKNYTQASLRGLRSSGAIRVFGL